MYGQTSISDTSSQGETTCKERRAGRGGRGDFAGQKDGVQRRDGEGRLTYYKQTHNYLMVAADNGLAFNTVCTVRSVLLTRGDNLSALQPNALVHNHCVHKVKNTNFD